MILRKDFFSRQSECLVALFTLFLDEGRSQVQVISLQIKCTEIPYTEINVARKLKEI